MIGFYPLFVAAGLSDREGMETVPHLMVLGRGHKVGGFSNLRTRSTTLVFSHHHDRDHAKTWLTSWASERGLATTGII